MISQSAYAKAILASGVADRKQTADHHDISATGKEIRDRVLQAIRSLDIKATNKPSGGSVASVDMGKVGPKAGKIAGAAAKLHGGGGGQLSIVFVGEGHESITDSARAQSLLDEIGTNPSFNDVVLVLERGFYARYRLPQSITSRVREENITSANGWEFGVDKLEHDNRTIVVAGYMLAHAADGDQNRNVLFVVVFGDRHADLAEQFEYLVRAASRYGVDWVEKRPRCYCRATSAKS